MLGLEHALDADHVVAVSTIVAEGGGIRRGAGVGALWGAGHTAALLAAGLPLLLFRVALPASLGLSLEAGVGVMLIALGLHTLAGWRRRQPHAHVHVHDGVPHVHFHTHAEGSHHRHGHGRPAGGLRPFLVGSVHGLAGSGAVTLLVAGAAPSVAAGVLYVVCFGLGTVVGMTLTSTLIGLPFALGLRSFRRAQAALRLVAGVLSVALGAAIVAEMGQALAARW